MSSFVTFILKIFFEHFKLNRFYFFFQVSILGLSKPDLSKGLDFAVMFCQFWHEYTKAFFSSMCFPLFGSLCIYYFSLFLLFFFFSLCCFCFVLVFCSCLHCFRYFFPPLDSPRAGSRWSSYAQLLPPPPPPLVEHSCDADTASLQYPHPRRRSLSRPLNPLPENEGV